MFTLQFETDNAAFEDDMQAEIARILRQLAGHAEKHMALEARRRVSGYLRDANGNKVGEWEFIP
jgi:hypothetical protein